MATIKARTTLREGRCQARILIRHPMSVGGRGEAPHFIQRVECTLNGRVLVNAHWGAGVSKNPYLSFAFTGATAGDVLSITWEDNAGVSDALDVTL